MDAPRPRILSKSGNCMSIVCVHPEMSNFVLWHKAQGGEKAKCNRRT